jgi:N6-adenosine-specific RNA methylase IME4
VSATALTTDLCLPPPRHAPFRVVVADPPWSFGDKLPGASRGAERNYVVMSVADICKFTLPPIADDAYLFLWRVASQVEQAYAVVRAWGFVPKTELVWRKLTSTGLVHFGMGRTLRASHETCIVAARGRPRPKSRSVRTIFDAPVGRHSQKPEVFFDLIEQVADGPYLELFARRIRPRWTCLGNEVLGADGGDRPEETSRARRALTWP